MVAPNSIKINTACGAEPIGVSASGGKFLKTVNFLCIFNENMVSAAATGGEV